MNDHKPASLDLDEIAARAAGLYEYATGLDAAWQDEADELAGTDVPALLAEVRRLRGALAEMRAARDVIASLHKDQEARLDAVNALCDREQRNAGRWENPLPVPEWVEAVRQAAAQPATHVDDRSDCNAAPAQ